MPLWVTVVMVSREFVINGLRSFYAGEGIIIYSSLAGKMKTTFQIVGIACVLFGRSAPTSYRCVGAGNMHRITFSPSERAGRSIRLGWVILARVAWFSASIRRRGRSTKYSRPRRPKPRSLEKKRKDKKSKTNAICGRTRDRGNGAKAAKNFRPHS